MYPFQDLQPEAIWQYFYEICQVPRPSKQEEQIIAYLLKFAQKHQLEVAQDRTGNVLIKKKASGGYENRPVVVLQSHIDMVCEKNSSTRHDFLKDPIQPFIEGEWVKATGTTLGADDGIGMAAQLAILAADNLPHGPLECLFTVDEETGLTGAFGLEPNFISGSTLINLDSEDEGEIFIGCAGGIDTVGHFTPQYEAPPKGSFAFKVEVSGLTGGHSGDDIHKGLGNAIKMLTRYVWDATQQLQFRLAAFQGGNLRNAIAREASATGVVPIKYKEEVRVMLNCFIADLEEELRDVEPGIKLHLESTELPEQVFTEAFHLAFVSSLYALPHGVMGMSREIEGLVETSTNLASVKASGTSLVVSTSQRSSIESARNNIASMVAATFALGGASVKHSDGYPGWAPNTQSDILKLSVASYQKLFKAEPQVKAIHAGLECGLFLKKYPGLDMISIGPTIKGAHSPDERLHIPTVKKFWDHLLDILAQNA
jgi:dipeptidase D